MLSKISKIWKAKYYIFHIYELTLERDIMYNHGDQELRGKENGELLISKCSFTIGCAGYTTTCMHSDTEHWTVHFQMTKIVNFVLSIVYQNKNSAGHTNMAPFLNAVSPLILMLVFMKRNHTLFIFATL
jgi:hypothetical protein